MNYPFTSNKIEQLDLDPIIKMNGLVWFNTIEKVYKTYIDDTLQIFMTDTLLFNNLSDTIFNELERKEFVIAFEEVYSLVVKHNKLSRFFNCTVFDSVENCTLPTSVEVLNENEIKIDFVEPVTGNLFMYFN